MPSLATLLLDHRRRRGLSQEELAEAAGLSLRTVQRLEKGERLPRGYTLQALARTLELPVEALTAAAPEAAPAAEPPPWVAPAPLPVVAVPVAPPPAPPADDVPAYVALMYLSAFSYALLPGANVLLPLWLRYRRRQEPAIRAAGSRLLDFELLWTLLTYGGYFLLLALQIGLLFRGHVMPVLLPLGYLFALNLLHAPLLLLGAWRARRGNYRGFPVGLRLF
jgi:transcriptional regulator with XRE-family HTH domain